MNYTEKGSKLYLFSIVLVAVIGGLLFGYDTAVISGADKGIQAFFMGASDLSTQMRFTASLLPAHLSDVSSVVLFRGSSHPIWDVRILFS